MKFMVTKMKIDISKDDFGTLCICAIRYCHGRQTYMPSLVQKIVRMHLREVSDNDLKVMLDDCRMQEDMPYLYGHERIDKPGWFEWRKAVEAELERRSEQKGEKLED